MFNTKISQQALDMIDKFPDLWNQSVYHHRNIASCNTCHCWLGWCDVILGNYQINDHYEDDDLDLDIGDSGVYDDTRKAMGLTEDELLNFTKGYNSLSRLKLLHKYFTERNTNPEAIFGIEGVDEEGDSLLSIEDFYE